jgi:hypothetical protein
VRRLLVTADVAPGSPILVTLKMEAILSSEKSILTRASRRHIAKDGILHSHRREQLKSYTGVRDDSDCYTLCYGSSHVPVCET